ncbi:MAG TPA: response regulator [Chloroflexota bacterium]|jgi:two-component system response regulator MprA|nr:response regulator [Chloroflexota bacterium]
MQEERTVLVADDDEALRALVAELLGSELGLRVVGAADGYQAILAIQRERPDLILLDLRMPRVDGYGVLRWLRSRGRTGGIPVLALSATVAADLAHALARGCQGAVAKPFDIDELLDAVRAALAPARRAAAG